MPTPVHLRGDPILQRLPRTGCVVVEVGCLTGTLSRYLLQHHNGLRLIAVDAWATAEQHRAEYRATNDPQARRTAKHAELSRLSFNSKMLEFENRVTVLQMFSVDAARKVRDGSCDMVFLDADHSEVGVRADLVAWFPKVRPGGWLGGHDYDNSTSKIDLSGVKRAVDEWANGREIERGSDFTWFLKL